MSTVADRLQNQRNEKSEKQDETQGKDAITRSVWLLDLLDFSKSPNVVLLVILRLVQACTMTWNPGHPD